MVVTKRAMGALVALVSSMVMLTASAQGGTPSQAPAKKPNIAVSGCLMRNGYATFMVADAHVDGTGDKAATAAPSTTKGNEAAGTPAKWILDNAGNVGSHVGEQVQVIGFSDWVTDQPASPAAPPEPGGPPAPMPHIDLQTLKVLANSCS